MINKKKLYTPVFFSAFLFLFGTGMAQNNFSVINYTTKNGLPENNVQTIFMDKEGFLWASFGNGLLRFDGRSFRKFLTSETPYITFYIYKTFNNEMLMVDASGSIFRITDKVQDTLRKGSVNSLNYLIIKGVLPGKDFYLKCTTPHIRTARDRNWFYSPMTIFPLSSEDCLIRTKKGIGLYHNKELQKEMNLVEFSPVHFISIGDAVYFFNSSNKLFRIDIKNWNVQPCIITGDILKNKSILETPNAIDKTFWNYNNSDPCLLSGNTIYSLVINNKNRDEVNCNLVTNQVPGNCLITDVIYDSEKHLLVIGTDTKGLFLLKEKQFKTLVYENPEEGTNNVYYSQLVTDSDRVFTDWNREFTINGAIKSKLPVNKNYSENIFRDSKGFLWYEQGIELIKYNPADNRYKKIYNPKKEFALCYFEEGDSLWIGTLNSLACIKNDSVKFIKQFYNNESNSNIFQVFRWNDDKMWICNYTGLFQFDTRTQKIDTIHPLYQKYPYNITLFKDYMMIGTYGRGYFFYKDGKTVQMPLDKNNYLQQVHTFLNDDKGYTWMATNNGLFRTRFADLVNYFNDNKNKVFFQHYGEEDGLSSLEFNGGCLPSHVVLKNGYVSIPNVEGLVWFKPDEILDATTESPFKIDAVYFDDSLVSKSTSFQIPSDIQSIHFDFTTPYWGNPENLILEYKLDGYNKQWITLNNLQSSLEFSNLRSGSYTLHIRKKNGLASDDYITTSIPVSIEKKFYERGWFIALCVLTGLLFVISVARLYAYNIRKKNKLLEEKVNQRTNELKQSNVELQKSIEVKDKLISIISHDILTPIKFISMVARKGSSHDNPDKKEIIQEALVEIKQTSEKLHSNAQNILNWIKHQNKRIQVNKSHVAIASLADEISESLSEMADDKKTKIINNISYDDILKTDKNILSIILHNVITNAIKFTNEGTIMLTAEFEEEQKKYCIMIRDSGSGIHPQQLKRIHQIISREQITIDSNSGGAGGNGLGYIIISELIEILGGTLKIESKSGEGTAVLLSLHVNQ